MCVYQARLEESQWQMEQDVSEMVNEARGEGVDRMMRLKKRYGCTKDNHELAVTQLKVDNVHTVGFTFRLRTQVSCSACSARKKRCTSCGWRTAVWPLCSVN